MVYSPWHSQGRLGSSKAPVTACSLMTPLPHSRRRLWNHQAIPAEARIVREHIRGTLLLIISWLMNEKENHNEIHSLREDKTNSFNRHFLGIQVTLTTYFGQRYEKYTMGQVSLPYFYISNE